MRRIVPATLGIGLLALIATACGSNESPASSGAGANTFGLGEFVITAPTNELEAGTVSITANNVGGEQHELVIVRADGVKSLSTRPDGSVDEEALPESAKVGEIEDIAPQSRKTKSFELTAGDYVAFCNLVDSMTGSGSTTMHGNTPMGDMHDAGMGHVHFAEGMSVAFTVR